MNSNFKIIKIQYCFCDEFIIFSMQSHVESDKKKLSKCCIYNDKIPGFWFCYGTAVCG